MIHPHTSFRSLRQRSARAFPPSLPSFVVWVFTVVLFFLLTVSWEAFEARNTSRCIRRSDVRLIALSPLPLRGPSSAFQLPLSPFLFPAIFRTVSPRAGHSAFDVDPLTVFPWPIRLPVSIRNFLSADPSPLTFTKRVFSFAFLPPRARSRPRATLLTRALAFPDRDCCLRCPPLFHPPTL